MNDHRYLIEIQCQHRIKRLHLNALLDDSIPYYRDAGRRMHSPSTPNCRPGKQLTKGMSPGHCMFGGFAGGEMDRG